MNKVLITGASRGLGQSLVIKYLEKGNIVFAACRSTPDSELEKLKEKYPDSLYFLMLDVADDKSVEVCAAGFTEQSESLDILINNAAVHFDETMAPLEEVNFESAMATLNTNVLGPLRVTKAFMPYLKKGNGRKIINISSEAGSIHDCWRDKEFDYCMSKAALNMQTKLLDNLLKKDGFTVLSVHPGWMRTDMGGMDADIDAAEAANGIYNIIETEKGNKLYLDYTGKEMHW